MPSQSHGACARALRRRRRASPWAFPLTSASPYAQPPIPDATVAFNHVTLRTERDGIGIAPIVLGQTEIRVTKKGVLPRTASISVEDARDWQIAADFSRSL